MGTQTIKFRYAIDNEDDRNILFKAIRQYNSCVHIAYNRLFDEDIVGFEGSKLDLQNFLYKELASYNNVELMSSMIRTYAVVNALSLKERFGDRKVTFGGRLNLSRYNRNLISKEEFREKRLIPIEFQGKANCHGNMFCIVNEDKTVTVKLNKNTHITLNLLGHDPNVKDRGTWKLLNRICEAQKNKKCDYPVCFKIDKKHVYISFTNNLYGKKSLISIKNRTFSIDMNPNFIGWSVNDWNGSGENKLIAHGVFSIEKLNQKDKFIKGKSGKSTLTNKRNNEVCIIAKKLAKKAAYYKCNIVGYEKLEFDPTKKNKGSVKLNRLLNRNWCREKFINCFLKWLNVYGYSVRSKKDKNTENLILEVVASYSSFIGNIIYGDKYDAKVPDPVNASIEIGRRSYEFYHQFILKDKEKTDVVFPVRDKVVEVCSRALEANEMDAEFRDWKSMKKLFDSKKIEVNGKKNSKDLYRVPFDNDTKWFKSSSKMSLITQFEKSTL